MSSMSTGLLRSRSGNVGGPVVRAGGLTVRGNHVVTR